MDILGEYVKIETSEGVSRDGIVVKVVQDGNNDIVQVQCHDDQLFQLPIEHLCRAAHDAANRQGLHEESVQNDQRRSKGLNAMVAKDGATPLPNKDLDLREYDVVMIRRPCRLKKSNSPDKRPRPHTFNFGTPADRTTIPILQDVRYRLDARRLIITDPCPVFGKLPYCQIGDQLFVSEDWKERSGKCDPERHLILPRPAKTIGYLLRVGLVVLGEKVVYRGGRDRVMAEGWIANNGILCARCGYVVGCTEFEKCAGMRMRKPGKHIQFADGSSLLECSLKLRANFC